MSGMKEWADCWARMQQAQAVTGGSDDQEQAVKLYPGGILKARGWVANTSDVETAPATLRRYLDYWKQQAIEFEGKCGELRHEVGGWQREHARLGERLGVVIDQLQRENARLRGECVECMTHAPSSVVVTSDSTAFPINALKHSV